MSGPSDSPFPYIPLLVFIAVCAISHLFVLWRERRRRRQLQEFAAGEGMRFHADESPIPLPDVQYSTFRRTVAEQNFLHGTRRGVEIFACDFATGIGRGKSWTTLLAVRGELRDTGRLDLKRWSVTFLNGWTFLIPKKPRRGKLSIREIVLLWDVLSTASNPQRATMARYG